MKTEKELTEITNRAIKREALQKPTELAHFLAYVDGRLKTVVEIGTAQGGMFGALCEVADPDALLVSIDLPGGDADEVSPNDKYGARDTDKMASYAQEGQRVEFLQMDSQDPATRATLLRILGGRKIDLLFIDGDHSYAGVKKDFDNYSPLVAEDGVIALHDIAPHIIIGCEVDRLWHELKRRFAVCRECIFEGAENQSWGEWGGIGIIDMREQ